MSLAERVLAELERLGSEGDAAAMTAYLKHVQPCYGVKKPALAGLFRTLRTTPLDDAGFDALFETLWTARGREARYCAIRLARRRDFVALSRLPLYERMVREGAWWDIVDEVACHLVGPVLHRAGQLERLDAWVLDEDLWVRRTAIIAQLGLKADTDWPRLQRYCLACAQESDFFIRKAIGWALRSYSRVDPAAVEGFLRAHHEVLSGLSYREGARLLRKAGRDLP